MGEKAELEALDLAALLCSRVCHDIISPVGAITNGLEVLDEDNSEEMKTFAFDLIRRSARQASAKLQFARLAFGAAGSAGAEIDLADAESVATGYMQGEKAQFSFAAPRVLMAKNLVKLLLNLILLANAAIPRGGSITVHVEGEKDAPRGRPERAPTAGLRADGSGRHQRRDGRRAGRAGILYGRPGTRIADDHNRSPRGRRRCDYGGTGGLKRGRKALDFSRC
jgi:hypothetical protein